MKSVIIVEFGYSDKLEKLQLDAARIATGLPIFSKSQYVYAETDWEILSERDIAETSNYYLI